MADPRHALGLAAEAATERWLGGLGWRVVARRRRPPDAGELDLVAIDPEGVLVAVEVRARRTGRAGQAGETLDARRVLRLRRSLAAVASAESVAHSGLRVDLVTAEPVDAEPGRWRLRRLPGVG